MQKKDNPRKVIIKISEFMEIAISVVILIVIATMLVVMIYTHLDDPSLLDSSESFRLFLKTILNFVIGIEFVKMLVIHSGREILEVLTLTIAKHMIISENTPVDILIQIAAIAGIFAIQRFLITKETEKAHNSHVAEISDDDSES